MSIQRMLLVMVAVLEIFGNDAFAIYASGTGRFMQRDPIGYAGGSMNLYQYVLSNPTKYVDPFGLEPGGNYDYDMPGDANWDDTPPTVPYNLDGSPSWTTLHFMNYYYRNKNWEHRDVTLDDMGLADWYKNKSAVKKKMNECRKMAKDLKNSLDAGGGCGYDQSSFATLPKKGIPESDFADPLGPGFSIGGHGFDCAVKCTRVGGKTSCTIEYSMEDVFEDPADIFNWFNGPGSNWEPFGGLPFGITYDWTETYP